MSHEAFAPLARGNSRAEAVTRQIEKRIADQRLVAGHRLGTKESLRLEFNVSVGTFNEAVRLLASRGTVEVRPGMGGGLFVANSTAFVRLGRNMLELSGESISVADSLVVRDGLEPLVMRDATRYATKHDVDALRKIMAQMEVDRLDAVHYLRVDWQLHRRMVEISPNIVLRNMYLGLLEFVSQRVHGVVSVVSLADPKGVLVHQRMVDVIESGDLSRVDQVVEDHSRLLANQSDHEPEN